jgi:hypothetical protein
MKNAAHAESKDYAEHEHRQNNHSWIVSISFFNEHVSQTHGYYGSK